MRYLVSLLPKRHPSAANQLPELSNLSPSTCDHASPQSGVFSLGRDVCRVASNNYFAARHKKVEISIAVKFTTSLYILLDPVSQHGRLPSIGVEAGLEPCCATADEVQHAA